MEHSFWQHKWASHEIGFHEPAANPLLVNHFDRLSLAPGARVFVPLCGKTLDIGWLLAQGVRVVGAELVESAVEQLFEGLGVRPTISRVGELKRYSAEAVEIFVGDIFALSAETLGATDAIYDRAALVALPEAMRRRYSAHLVAITDGAPQLLITYEYDPAKMTGPPFSIGDAEVARHYQDRYRLTRLASGAVAEGLKGCAATETVWLLHKKGIRGLAGERQ